MKVIDADVCVGQDTLGISNCAGTTTNPYPVVQAILASTFDTHAHEFYGIQRESEHWLPSLQLEKRLNDDNMIGLCFLFNPFGMTLETLKSAINNITFLNWSSDQANFFIF